MHVEIQPPRKNIVIQLEIEAEMWTKKTKIRILRPKKRVTKLELNCLSYGETEDC